MKFKIKYADIIVGVLSIFAIAALIVLIFLIGTKQKWFEQKHPFYTVVTSADGVSEGMEIKYKGFGIGKTTSITLDENDRVVVKFYVLDEHIERVSKGSVLELAVSPIGLGSSLVFHPGTSGDIAPDGSLIPEKSSYEGRRRISGGEVIIADSTDTISTLLASVSEVIQNVNKVLSDVDSILQGSQRMPIAKTVTNVNTILSQITRLLDGDKSIPIAKIVNDLEASIAQLDGILGNVSTLTDSIKDPQGLVPKLLETEESAGAIDKLLASINSTMADVNNISTSLKGDMPQVTILLTQLQGLLKQGQDVLEGVKNISLIKKGVSEEPVQESSTPRMREENF